MHWLTRVVGAAVVVAYPLLVCFGLAHWSVGQVAAGIAGLALVTWLVRFRRLRVGTLWAIGRIPLAIGVLAGLAATTGDATFLLALPVLTNLVLLWVFARSLTGETTMVESFARLQEPDLSAEKVAYCRQVTVVWSWFFVANGLAAACLALFAPLAWWALFTGTISYLLVGGLFLVEYLVRLRRFPSSRESRARG